MATTRCRFGHSYDDSKHSECPWCKAAADGGETVPAGTAHMRPPPPAGGNINTVPLNQGTHEQKTVFFYPDKLTEIKTGVARTDPVVGWLVCYDGVEKGKDYRIRFGQNSVGRNDKWTSF